MPVGNPSGVRCLQGVRRCRQMLTSLWVCWEGGVWHSECTVSLGSAVSGAQMKPFEAFTSGQPRQQGHEHGVDQTEHHANTTQRRRGDTPVVPVRSAPLAVRPACTLNGCLLPLSYRSRSSISAAISATNTAACGSGITTGEIGALRASQGPLRPCTSRRSLLLGDVAAERVAGAQVDPVPIGLQPQPDQVLAMPLPLR